MEPRWIGTGAAAKSLNVSRQALLRQAKMLEHDRVAQQLPNGRWKFDSRRLGGTYDAIVQPRVDSPRFAVTHPQQTEVDDDLPSVPGVFSDAEVLAILAAPMPAMPR